MKGGNKREAWKNYYQTSRCTHISDRHRKVGQKKGGMKAAAEKKSNETEIKKTNESCPGHRQSWVEDEVIKSLDKIRDTSNGMGNSSKLIERGKGEELCRTKEKRGIGDTNQEQARCRKG